MKHKNKKIKGLEAVKSKGNSSGGIGGKTIYLLLSVFIVVGVIAGLSLSSFISGSQRGINSSNLTDPSQLRGGETKQVLEPSYFIGQTARAYQIAQEIPEILDSLYCYCDCKRHSGHKSLLSCFTDLHAANCDICQNEAIRASELYKKGMDVIDIRKAIDREFGRG